MCEPARRVAGASRETGWRSLIVVHDGDLARGIELASRLAMRECLLVAPKEYRRGLCKDEYSPMDIEEYLGSEYDSAIVASPGLLRPNVLASAGETVRRGGFLAVVVPPRGSWEPGAGKGNYRRYLESRIVEARLHAWVEARGGECVAYSTRIDPPPPVGARAWRLRSRRGVPRRLLEAARTMDQARGLDAAVPFLRGRVRSLYVTGPRGRGKSFLAGLVLALAVYWHVAGRVEVTGPSLASVQGVFRGLISGLEALGLASGPGVKRVVSRGRVVRVSGPWFRVSYEEPGAAEGAPLVVVDEAGAVGVARTRSIAWRSGRIMAVTTTHGYEGSGRVYARMVEQILPLPLSRIVLEEPIRYLPGDPLEEWLYRAFLLDVEPTGPRDARGTPEYRVVEAGELAGDWGLLSRVYSILALAHYRNQPDDILALLESEGYWVHVLSQAGDPLAVALALDESPGQDPRRRLGVSRLALYAEGAMDARAVRVSRIAVLPWLQRRGLGSLLLSRLEEWARSKGYDLVDTIFSRHDVIGFWARNGYTFYYASPRYNRVTGEKNLAAAKPLTRLGEDLVLEAGKEFRVRLVLTLDSIYRDLAAEKALVILETLPGHLLEVALTPNQWRRLRDCALGSLDPEQAWDGLVLLARAHYSSRLSVKGAPGVYLLARLLQGKPHDESARIAGLPLEEASRVLREYCSRVYEEALEGRVPGVRSSRPQA